MRALIISIMAAASIAAAKPHSDAGRAALVERAEEIERCAASNDLAGVRRELNAVDWREIEDVKSAAKELAKVLPKGKEGAELKRELKTKLVLLADDPETVSELAGVEAYQLNIVRAPTVEFAPIVLSSVEIAALTFIPVSVASVSIDGVQVTYTAVNGLAVPVLDTGAVKVAFVLVDNLAFANAMSIWEQRWGIALDALGMNKSRLVPHPATALGQQRAALVTMIEREGWTKETETAWSVYYSNLSNALGRRERLKKRKL